MHEPSPPDEQDRPNGRPSEQDRASLARLLALVVSAGLAWATIVTLLAWLAGRLVAHG